MTRYAILSDVHGNLEALEACLEVVEGADPDVVVCLGDVVGYGPRPSACVERVREAAAVVVAGNHDVAVADGRGLDGFNRLARATGEWSRRVLEDEERAWLADLPLVELGDGATFVHASPDAPEEFPYLLSLWDVRRAAAVLDTRLAFVGHTHVPVVFHGAPTEGIRVIREPPGTPVPVPDRGRTLVNVGSVGQPRDGDPRAALVVWDADENTVTTHRVAYDIDAVRERIERAGLPEDVGRRLAEGR